GSGKTTAAAKLALLLRKEKRKPGLVAADLQRPAAIDQLEQLGRQIQVPVYREDTTDPVVATQKGIERAREDALDVVIVDTAGRGDARAARVRPPRPDGLAHPRHGRRAVADRAGRGGGRGGRARGARGPDDEGPVHLRRLPEELQDAAADGPAPRRPEADPRPRQAARRTRPSGREAARARRGDRALDDAA